MGGDDPATVVISRLLDENRQVIGDPTNISGTIYVLLDVQNNEETVAGIDLTLTQAGGAGVPIECRNSAGDAGAEIPGLAETGAQYEVECQLKTDERAQTDEGKPVACVGLQIDPMFANGEYLLSAELETTTGATREAFAGQSIALKNHGRVLIAQLAGR